MRHARRSRADPRRAMDVDRASPPARDRPVRVRARGAGATSSPRPRERARAHARRRADRRRAERGAAEVAARGGTLPASAVCDDGAERVVPGWLDALQDAGAATPRLATSSAPRRSARGPTALDAPAAGEAAGAAARLRGALAADPAAAARPGARLHARHARRARPRGTARRRVRRAAAPGGAAARRRRRAARPPGRRRRPGAPRPDGARGGGAARRAAPSRSTGARAGRPAPAEGLSATIDARILHGATAGTQVHTLELIAGAAPDRRAAAAGLLSPDVRRRRAARVLEALDGVERVAAGALGTGHAPALGIVAPARTRSAARSTCRRCARWATGSWSPTRTCSPTTTPPTTRTRANGRAPPADAGRLAAADPVVAFSGHAARDLGRGGPGAGRARARGRPIGTDHRLPRLAPAPRRPGSPALAGPPFLLCLGTDLRHKNRPFALDAARARSAAAAGTAGSCSPGRTCRTARPPATERGAAAADEAAARSSTSARSTSRGRRWLYRDAAAVRVPDAVGGLRADPVRGGRGRHAAALRRGLLARRAAPGEAALLVPWDAEASADRALALLRDPGAAARAGRRCARRRRAAHVGPRRRRAGRHLRGGRWRVPRARPPRSAGPCSRRRRGAPRRSTRTTAWTARSPPPATRSWAATALLDEHGPANAGRAAPAARHRSAHARRSAAPGRAPSAGGSGDRAPR